MSARRDSGRARLERKALFAARTLEATAGRAVGTLQRCVRKLSREHLEGLAAGLGEVLIHLPAPLPALTVRRMARRRSRRAK